jgi:hypothetical protein
MDPSTVSPWSSNWVWSLPIIVMTVVIHAFGLGLLNQRVSLVVNRWEKKLLPRRISAIIMGGTALYAAVLHGFEASIWAAAYILLGSVPDRKSAMLYSLSAMTTYGHTSIHLEPRWQLMGSLEALNGWILFGLTTALLFGVMQKVWPNLELSA